ncbi:hypothetical protein ACVJA9_007914 [Bradyrhizobium diazoefficiens]
MIVRDMARSAKRRLIKRFPPVSAKELLRGDRQFEARSDCGPVRAVELTLDWLCRAQDMSPGRDGGVSGFYTLGSGWSASYPETTGYIVCSFIDQGLKRCDDSLLDRARLMLDWLVKIQFPEGGFQSGLIDAARPVPVTFNTGQILLGLARGTEVLGDRYRDAMARAANWLVETQDADGCWRRAPTPLAAPGEKAYETHVSWGLFEAARVSGRQSWGTAGLRQVRWAISKLQPNGWMADCCMTDEAPLTHTLGYALKGIIEAYRFSNDRFFLDAAVSLADGLGRLHPGGRLSGWAFAARLVPSSGLGMRNGFISNRLVAHVSWPQCRSRPVPRACAQAQPVRSPNDTDTRRCQCGWGRKRILPDQRRLFSIWVSELGRQVHARRQPIRT